MLVAENVIRDKEAEQRVNDKRPGHWKSSRVVWTGMEDIGVRRLRKSGEKEADCARCGALTETLTVEGLCHCG